MAATTTLLSLVTPTQGTLSGTWGDTVNYGISDYLDIAIAGTLSFAGDGAITLANTTGSASGNAITSTTAQYMVIRITGTQTITKVITGPSYSKLYMVDHAGATSAVTFKAFGQSGVSVAVGEKCFVYYNGTDYVKIATSTAGTVTSVAATVPSIFSISGSPITTSGTLAMTYSGTALPAANGGTGVANNAAMTVTGSGNFAYTRTLTGTTNVTFPTTGTLATLGGVETFTGTKTLAGTSATLAMILTDTAEIATVSATAATGTINYDVTTQSVIYYTSNASANWTVNFRASSGTSLNTAMSTGQSVTAAFLVTQGSTAYYNSVVQVDGSTVTPKYQGGTAPAAGNASSVDVYMYTIVKTGNAAFTVFASQTKFA
jgi:hypothetical protein